METALDSRLTNELCEASNKVRDLMIEAETVRDEKLLALINLAEHALIQAIVANEGREVNIDALVTRWMQVVDS